MEHLKDYNYHRWVEETYLGKTILIKKMEGEPHYTGKKGKVTHVDCLCTLHGTWGGCGVILAKDDIEIIEEGGEEGER